MRFHQKDEDKTAWLDADLVRLQFGHNKAVGEEKDARYKAALKRFVEQVGRPRDLGPAPASSGPACLQQENDLVEAHELAKQGWEAFRNTVGGRMCFNLVQQIEAKSARS